MLSSTRAPIYEEAARQDLRERGYVEGENIVLEWRWSEGKPEQYPVLASELVQLKVDVIVTVGNAAALAAKRATNTIPIAVYFPESELVELHLSRRGFEAMARFVDEEYQRDREGQPVRLERGLYGASWFYAAHGTYHLFNTCNTWVARALRAAELPVTPTGVITAGGVISR